ncbi:MAG: type II toxin-antitoxin system Phd/YefM family antitoxin [Clostridiales bacterium]|nr:type II toxin-antitoxin system Phd/YefM family antitoxin [Clostridiales bacterium]
MTINANSLISITEANQNFSRVTRLVDERGAVIIMKNNAPRYLMVEFSQVDKEQTLPDEDVLSISRRILTQNKEAYEVLAK